MGEEIVNTFSSVEIFSAVVWHSHRWDTLIRWPLRPVNSCVPFPVSFNARFFSSGFGRKFPHQFPSTRTVWIMQIVNQNRPTILFIQHHLICSHLAVVCNGITVSMETAQTAFEQYQTFHPKLVDNWISICSTKNH